LWRESPNLGVFYKKSQGVGTPLERADFMSNQCVDGNCGKCGGVCSIEKSMERFKKLNSEQGEKYVFKGYKGLIEAIQKNSMPCDLSVLSQRMDEILNNRVKAFMGFPVIVNYSMPENEVLLMCGKGVYKRIQNILEAEETKIKENKNE
jgi:hypothetical protein